MVSLIRFETYSKGQDGVANTADDVLNAKWNVVETFNYEYTNQTEIYAPTSIDGYEYNEASAIAISQ